MKTIKRLSVVFALVVAATISSCGGSNEPEVPPAAAIPATGTYINATVDGGAFTTVIAGQSAGSAVRTGTGASNLIIVGGSSVNLSTFATTTISINLFGVIAPGTYTVNSTTDSVLAYVTANAQGGGVGVAYSTGECNGATGTVTVTSISATKIEGTFSFTGKNEGCTVTKSVTAGSFRGVFN